VAATIERAYGLEGPVARNTAKAMIRTVVAIVNTRAMPVMIRKGRRMGVVRVGVAALGFVLLGAIGWYSIMHLSSRPTSSYSNKAQPRRDARSRVRSSAYLPRYRRVDRSDHATTSTGKSQRGQMAVI